MGADSGAALNVAESQDYYSDFRAKRIHTVAYSMDAFGGVNLIARPRNSL